eukprot:353077-Chlamydomonas_euryale.AAC.15
MRSVPTTAFASRSYTTTELLPAYAASGLHDDTASSWAPYLHNGRVDSSQHATCRRAAHTGDPRTCSARMASLGCGMSGWGRPTTTNIPWACPRALTSPVRSRAVNVVGW